MVIFSSMSVSRAGRHPRLRAVRSSLVTRKIIPNLRVSVLKIGEQRSREDISTLEYLDSLSQILGCMSVLIIPLILEGYQAITDMEKNLLSSAKVPAKGNKEIWDTSLMMEAQLPLSFPQSKQQFRYKCGDDSSRKTAYVRHSRYKFVKLRQMMLQFTNN